MSSTASKRTLLIPKILAALILPLLYGVISFNNYREQVLYYDNFALRPSKWFFPQWWRAPVDRGDDGSVVLTDRRLNHVLIVVPASEGRGISLPGARFPPDGVATLHIGSRSITLSVRNRIITIDDQLRLIENVPNH